MQSTPFLGEFDPLPVRAHLDHGAVPSNPSMVDFDYAMTSAINADPWTMRGAAAIWHGEAVRWRRSNPGVALDLHAIGAACALRVKEAQDEDLNPGAKKAAIRDAHKALYRELAAEGLIWADPRR